MANFAHKWIAQENDALIAQLVRGAPVIDMHNPRLLGYYVEAVATMLSRNFAEAITREDVAMQVIKLQQRYERFERYLVTDRVTYDVQSNKVRINALFKQKFRKEPRDMGIMRRDGEPWYVELRRIFIVYHGAGAQWAWLLDVFRRGTNDWLTDPRVPPLWGHDNNNHGRGAGADRVRGRGHRQGGSRN